MSGSQVENREDGIVIFASNGDPILKLGEDGTLLHSFGSHVLDSKAAKLDEEALGALVDWATEALHEAIADPPATEPEPTGISGGGGL